jgi:hypothetical protein
MVNSSRQRKHFFLLAIILFIISCGSDIVDDIIESYDSGSKKIYVRYHPDVNVLEKHFYNSSGEMIHLERDSLSYDIDFEKFMLGTWIMEKMTVNDEVVFEKDSAYSKENLPNIYTFSKDTLIVKGPQYRAIYNIDYIDSSQVELEGQWTYGDEGEISYRTQRIYDIDHFQIQSYYNFIWTDFLEDTEKEEEVLFRRIDLSNILGSSISSFNDSTLSVIP